VAAEGGGVKLKGSGMRRTDRLRYQFDYLMLLEPWSFAECSPPSLACERRMGN
jgi:hypothetical protein